MQSTTCSTAQHPPVVEPMQFLLLLSLVPEIAPRIYLRLPGPDLLRFARICKQTHALKQTVIQGWTSQEFNDIGALDGEQRWMRFLDLMANCGEMIDPGRWENFLDSVASEDGEEALAMQLAALSPALGKLDSQLKIRQPQQVGQAGPETTTVFWKLINGAHKSPVMGIAACAALTGLWRHLSSGDMDAMPVYVQLSFPKAFANLPLNLQVKALPRLEADCRRGRLDAGQTALVEKAYREVCKLHAASLHGSFLNPSCKFSFQTCAPAYLACLGRLFRDVGQADPLSYAWFADLVKINLGRTRGMVNWREEAPEFALLAFLALQWKPEKEFLDQEKEKVFIKCGFVTARERDNFMRYLETDTKNTTYDKVQQ